MKDTLKDIIDHTSAIGVDLIKVEGSDKETTVSATAEDRSVIVTGTFKNPISEFIGTFGMPNLGKLKTILGFDDYDESSTINVTKQNRDGSDVPTAIHFQTKNNDFVNDYRLMAKAIVEEKVRSVAFKGAQWNVDFEPSIAGIQRLKKQQQANSEENTFVMKVENNELKIYFGDPSTHSGNFVFETNVSGDLKKS